MKAVFRVDSAPEIGGGHLMRCLSLAEVLRGQNFDIEFICRDRPGNLSHLLHQKNFPVSLIKEPKTNFSHKKNIQVCISQAIDAAETALLLSEQTPDWLIVDHYGLDIEWESLLSQSCKRMMVIDDLANRYHRCNLLLDQNYPTKEKNYNNLVPSTCAQLLGPKYALLRNDFQLLRDKKKSLDGNIKNILVFFTAGDDQGETLKALEGVVIYGESIAVNVVIGLKNPDHEDIRAMCITHKWSLHCEIDNMADLIAQADLVIGGGGSSNWERCALGVPALVTILAPNQDLVARALHDAGVIVNLGHNKDIRASDYAAALRNLTAHQLISIGEKAFSMVDGKGAERVAETLTMV